LPTLKYYRIIAIISRICTMPPNFGLLRN